jgi:hypothetical protein
MVYALLQMAPGGMAAWNQAVDSLLDETRP